MFCIKGAGLEKTSLAKVVGIFNKVKENKKFEPGNTRETPGKHRGNTRETPMKHPGKVHSLIHKVNNLHNCHNLHNRHNLHNLNLLMRNNNK
jgi:hypothetical protein